MAYPYSHYYLDELLMFSWEGTNVAVTGGAGFIGNRLADKLISLGANVKIIDSRIIGKSTIFSNKLSKIQFIQGNLKNKKFIRNAICEAEVVFDLAPQTQRSKLLGDEPAEGKPVQVGTTGKQHDQNDCKQKIREL